MADNKSSKKITNVESDNITTSSDDGRVFTPSEENSKKAKMNRIRYPMGSWYWD